MPIIRTPDERFAQLPDFPFAPHYAEVTGGARMHYVDEGSGETILCLHGEPSWSYLYRKMIPALAAGHRVIAPDLIGFGRSDKYTETADYTFAMHHDALVAFLDALALSEITLVCQDWGGLLGLCLAAELPDRFARLVIMNTGLPTGDEPATRGFLAWQAFALRSTDLPIGRIIRSGTAQGDQMPEAVVAAYEAPFPDDAYKAGAKAFPALVPTSPDQEASAPLRHARRALARWDKPALVMFSDGDPITRGGDAFFRRLIPTAKDQPEITIPGAGHFLQEDKGEELAAHILAFLERTPLSRA
ncbi:MAG TPA: haloalkane dehalogenase [Ktedonobacterales bacterium]|nr:haloalkane dehalogenase [Ktedonobacterales bacterium]